MTLFSKPPELAALYSDSVLFLVYVGFRQDNPTLRVPRVVTWEESFAVYNEDASDSMAGIS